MALICNDYESYMLLHIFLLAMFILIVSQEYVHRIFINLP